MTVNFTWKLVTGLTLSGACLLLMAALFSCCYLACKEINFSKASYGMLISVVIMLGGGNFFNEKKNQDWIIIFKFRVNSTSHKPKGFCSTLVSKHDKVKNLDIQKEKKRQFRQSCNQKNTALISGWRWDVGCALNFDFTVNIFVFLF